MEKKSGCDILAILGIRQIIREEESAAFSRKESERECAAFPRLRRYKKRQT